MRIRFPNCFNFYYFLYSSLIAVIFSANAHFPCRASGEKYAAFVMDAHTGRVLHAEKADTPRHPASLTKMMTLYLTFEALEKRKIKKTTRVPFSVYAASQSPTKLGVPAGHSITVEQAIHALIVRSANDASVALAELLAASHKQFAVRMTKKARALGMKKTLFKNPNGLPDRQQITTARDMAILGIALRKRFPEYYKYFSTRSFNFQKKQINNHNKLLGEVKGVDGIKTGYTHASGFNLVSSVSDGKRRIVAVVMGGKTARARDYSMKKLIKIFMPMASSRASFQSDNTNKRASSPPQDYNFLLPNTLSIPYAMLKKIQENPLKQENIAALPLHISSFPYPRLANKRAATEKNSIEKIILENVLKDPPQATSIHAYAEESYKDKSLSLVHTQNLSFTAKKNQWTIRSGAYPSLKAARKIVKKKKQLFMLKKITGDIASEYAKGSTHYYVNFRGFDSAGVAKKACHLLTGKGLSCTVLSEGKKSKEAI